MPPTPDLSFTGLDEFVNKPVIENKKFDEEVSKVVRKSDDSLIIKDWVSNSEEENVSQTKTEKKTGKPHIDYKIHGVIESVCTRNMTGKIPNLTDYEEIDGVMLLLEVTLKRETSGKGADIAKILKKWLKPGKHEHGNGRACKEPGKCYIKGQWSTQVNIQSNMVNTK
ncbi:hypothetical protein Tco_1033182 [Tanacetum coccineum]|uniref:Uncharacterized protein n=1 Tax=Tanacetum coccineum TaxID=301880 RepID=A0ABQ5GEK0_9ASTR